jgi:hypothetical protein
VTAKSRVSRIGPVSVPPELEKAAREIAVPPTSKEMPLRDVEKSPVKSMLSIRGQVIAVSITYTLFFWYSFILNLPRNSTFQQEISS